MRFTVLGAGRTGQVMACYLMERGGQVTVWDRCEETVSAIAAGGIRVSGLCEGHYRPTAEKDLAKAVAEAEYILLMTTAQGHLPLARALRGILPRGCRIVVFNGCWGALELWSELGEECAEKGILIGETGGMPILSGGEGPGLCQAIQIKKTVSLASIPAAGGEVMAAELAEMLPFLSPCANVVETSLNNANPILHAGVSLFNITRMENGEDYGFYANGASPSVVALVEKMDRERLAILRALNVKRQSTLDIINSFWEEKQPDLYSAIRANVSYMAVKGPTSTAFRYITEDVPFGIAPMVQLGEMLGVPVPCLKEVLNMYQLLLGEELAAKRPAVTPLALQQILQ